MGRGVVESHSYAVWAVGSGKLWSATTWSGGVLDVRGQSGRREGTVHEPSAS